MAEGSNGRRRFSDKWGKHELDVLAVLSSAFPQWLTSRQIAQRVKAYADSYGELADQAAKAAFAKQFQRDRAKRRRLARRSIAASFRFFLAIARGTGVLDYRINNLDALRNDRGCLVVANHPTLIDYVILASVMPETDCLVKSALQGDYPTARRIHLDRAELCKALFEEGNPAGIRFSTSPSSAGKEALKDGSSRIATNSSI